MKILLFGSSGWIGEKLDHLLRISNNKIIQSVSRLENTLSIINELENIKPDAVVIAAGLTGRPNVDWCEDNKERVYQVNVLGTCTLASECYKRNIYVAYFGTGCIYEYTRDKLIFTEKDEPNFSDSYYSKTKIITEKVLKELPNVLILRIRMPLSDDLHPRNFITKITKYQKVVNIPNSMTVLHELLPIACDMINKKKTGVYNFTNPGVISHNEILEFYKTYIDPNFRWENFSVDEQAKILKAGRSNNQLNVNKLLQEYPNINNITIAVKNLFRRMKAKLILNNFLTKNILISRIGWLEIDAINKNTITPQLQSNTGFYGNKEVFDKWKELYLDCLRTCNYLLIPPHSMDSNFYNNIFNKQKISIKPDAYPNYLEFYLEMFENMKDDCLIVSSKVQTMKYNLNKIKSIFPHHNINKKLFHFVKVPDTYQGETYPHDNWYQTYLSIFKDITKKIEKHSIIRYLLLSCGCYGLPLATTIYKKFQNISVMYCGGILQLAFGIRGKRWDNRPEIKKYINKNWTRPLPSETPKCSNRIEGGCYW